MTPKNMAEPSDDESRGVLDDTASIDTTSIGILGGIAQVSVELPKDEDDDLADDGVVEGEVVADLVIDEPVAAAKAAAEISEASPATPMIIDLPPEPATVVGRESVAEGESVSDEDGSAGAERETGEAEAVLPEAEPDVETELVERTESAEAPESSSPIEIAPEPSPEPEILVGTASAIERTVLSTDVVAAEAQAAVSFAARARADVETRTRSRAAASRLARAEKESSVDASEAKAVTVPTSRAARSDAQLSSKRLDDLGDGSRESADLLTADRLLDPHRVTKPEPEGAWSHFLYTISGRRINIGDGRRARERKALSARIAAPLPGGARFVPVLSRKGGVGKTTITALLGMALADARDDRVIAVDANPDRGTLADRVVRPHHTRSVRDLVRTHDEVTGYHDVSAIVARDATRLDVLASDSDPRVAEAFSDSDYRDVADVAAHYYSLVLTDTGTGIVHSVMSATLDLADQIIVVSGLSVDEARLASETLTWLETNGYSDQARDAVVVLNQSTPGAPLVRLSELETHFRTRVKHVVRMPYDAQIAGGGAIVFTNLQPETRVAARQLAALLVEGLRMKAA